MAAPQIIILMPVTILPVLGTSLDLSISIPVKPELAKTMISGKERLLMTVQFIAVPIPHQIKPAKRLNTHLRDTCLLTNETAAHKMKKADIGPYIKAKYFINPVSIDKSLPKAIIIKSEHTFKSVATPATHHIPMERSRYFIYKYKYVATIIKTLAPPKIIKDKFKVYSP
jgi:hypothetical protein